MEAPEAQQKSVKCVFFPAEVFAANKAETNLFFWRTPEKQFSTVVFPLRLPLR